MPGRWRAKVPHIDSSAVRCMSLSFVRSRVYLCIDACLNQAFVAAVACPDLLTSAYAASLLYVYHLGRQAFDRLSHLAPARAPPGFFRQGLCDRPGRLAIENCTCLSSCCLAQAVACSQVYLGLLVYSFSDIF